MEETTEDFMYLLNATEDTTQYFLPEESIDPNVFQAVKSMNILIYSMTFILGTLGNGLVIWIAGFKMHKTVNIIWFLNLAIADFIFNILFPLQITEWVLDGHWPFGQIMCKVIFTALFLNMSVSTSFLMIISIDRCTSVMCPVWSKNHRTLKLASSVSFCVWTACLILSSPYLAFFTIDHDEDDGISYCIPAYSSDYHTDQFRDQAMFIARFTFMFFIPFTIILICYSLITHRLRRNRNLSGSSRPLKVIAAIVLSFFCLWFPFHFWPFLDHMNIGISDNINFIVFHVVYALGFCNSCVNPLVYAFVGRDFKKSLLKSFPFLLESTFQEKCENEIQRDQTMSEIQRDQTMIETEMETYN
ncbi:formyl peptide receptor-related sequence 4-like [Hyperolius riggenbachi]|uniref:formyl peptide receptor-related sequence 4-like n=1 Tax=Hyperolius riggenbachi TaxID=752182 RepID=UPI0035A31E44